MENEKVYPFYKDKSWQEIFAPEISYIDSNDVKILLDTIFDRIGDYHKVAPASSTGKYHPTCSNGDGGLVRHIKYVVRLAFELIRATPEIEEEKDEIIAAAILHDLMKYPNNNANGKEYTDSRHPTLMSNLILETFPSSKKAKTIARLVACHQGRKEWNTDRATGIQLNPAPKELDEYVLHYADLIASRKFICPEFDENGNIIY